jgi:hypothetical protein
MKINYLKIILFALLSTTVNVLFSQHNQGFNLALHVCVPEESVRPHTSVKSLLESKLIDMVSTTGMTGYAGGRFFISPKITIVNKQVLDGPPAKVVADIAITFFVADNTDQKVVNSFYKELKGVGVTTDQAIMNAVKGLNSKDKEFTLFIQEARTRIVQFYNQNCDAIISSAQSMSVQHISQAIENLSLIPMENTECYRDAQIQLQLLSANYYHRRCAEAIAQARAIWSATYTIESADRAIESLDSFFIDEECQKELKMLSEEMRARVEKNEEFDRALTNLLIESENKKMELDAEILKEIIRSQPKQVYNTEFIFVD